MKDTEKILLDDYVYIPIFEKGAATLQNPKVKNLVIKPCRTISFEYVEKNWKGIIIKYYVFFNKKLSRW